MIRVLHVITSLDRGGAENHLVTLVREQVERGLKVAVAYLKGTGYWTNSLTEMGVRVESLRLRRYGDIAPVVRLRRLVEAWAPDVVHAHMPPAELYTRVALFLNRSTTVMVVSKHNDEPFYRGIGQRLVGRWASRRAAHVIAISDAVNAYIREQLGIATTRMTTVHYGIDPLPYEQVGVGLRMEVRSAWGISPGTLVMGTVARFVPQKALDMLLRAYACYRSLTQGESRLVVVGQGPLEGELRRLSHQLGLEDRVIWAGFREDIPAVMNAFDVFALSSSYEGFGLVLLEAMAAARPVVATEVSAIPEIVQHGTTGLLCRPGDHESFARHLLSLEDTDLRARLGAAGRDRIRRCFTVERMVEKTLAIYRESLG